MNRITKEEFQNQLNGLIDEVTYIWEERDNLEEKLAEAKLDYKDVKEELAELRNDIANYKRKMNALITNDTLTDGEAMDRAIDLLNESL